MSAITILWLSSRHQPSLRQLEALKELKQNEKGRILGNICVAVPEKHAQALKEKYREETGRLRRASCEITVIPYQLYARGDGKVLKSAIREMLRSGVIGSNDLFVFVDTRAFDTAHEVIERFRGADFDDLVFVGPLSALDYITKAGLEPMRALMDPMDKSDMRPADFTDPKTGNRKMFTGYARVHGFDIRETKVIESLCC